MEIPVEVLAYHMHEDGPESEGDAAWRAIVTSILLRDADDADVRSVYRPFFEGWPGPKAAAALDSEPSAEKQIVLLNDVAARRAKVGMIRRLARVWLQRRPPEARVLSLPGCKKREEEAYFVVVNHLTEGEIEDPVLGEWMRDRAAKGRLHSEERDMVAL